MKKFTQPDQIRLAILTPFFILLSHYLAVFPHEYAHSFAAWLLGYKTNPFALNYGGTHWVNLLLLANIDENVNYQLIHQLGHNLQMAFIAFAGPGIANGLLFILSYYLIQKNTIQEKRYFFYFLFWFNLMNLGNLYDYVPIRTFSSYGDIAHIAAGLNLSPWWIYTIIGYLVVFLVWQFYTKTLITAYIHLKINKTVFRASLMILCTFILFGFFGGILGILVSKHPLQYGEITYFSSITSFLIIPGILISAWPTRQWVLKKIMDNFIGIST